MHGSPTFHKLLEQAHITHEKKSHDYASTANPCGNYHFAGLLANLFRHSSHDAGFVGRIGEKIYRLANLENSAKTPKNESIEDTELDILVITGLWMADRRDRRSADIKEEQYQSALDFGDSPDLTVHYGRTTEPYNKYPPIGTGGELGHIRDNPNTPNDPRIDPNWRHKKIAGPENPLQNQLFDLIKLMPDSQTEELIQFIYQMRAIRQHHRESNRMHMDEAPKG